MFQNYKIKYFRSQNHSKNLFKKAKHKQIDLLSLVKDHNLTNLLT